MPPRRKRETSTEPHSDAESEVSSAQDDLTTSKASKDRECPFCYQAFTSSSLGRHLDLYIRPVNAKRPDGIHNVDEIRRIRGGITRRQPKGTGKTSKDREALREHSVQETRSDTGDVDKRRSSNITRQLPKPYLINGMDWRSTGVINEIRSTPPNTGRSIEYTNEKTPGPQLPPLENSNPIARQHDETLEEQIETGRAAELALREVLNSLAAARQEHEKTVLFDGVDLCTLSFPTLCLTVLQSPRTLFSAGPFPDADSFGLQAPSEREKGCLLSALETHRLPKRIQEHVEDAYEQWIRLSEQEKTTSWIIEVLRSHSKAKDSEAELRTQLSLARQRIVHLESQYEMLSRCQLPRERMLNPPTTVPITKTTLDHPGMDLSPEAMIDKWRTTVRTVARPRKPASSALTMRNYADSAIKDQIPNSMEPGTMELSSDIIMQGAVFGVEGPMSRVGQFSSISHEVVPYSRPHWENHASKVVDHG